MLVFYLMCYFMRRRRLNIPYFFLYSNLELYVVSGELLKAPFLIRNQDVLWAARFFFTDSCKISGAIERSVVAASIAFRSSWFLHTGLSLQRPARNGCRNPRGQLSHWSRSRTLGILSYGVLHWIVQETRATWRIWASSAGSTIQPASYSAM